MLAKSMSSYFVMQAIIICECVKKKNYKRKINMKISHIQIDLIIQNKKMNCLEFYMFFFFN